MVFYIIGPRTPILSGQKREVALRKKLASTPHVDVQISRSAISFKIGQKRMFSSSMHGNASSVSPNRRADARAIIRFRDRSSLPTHFRLLEIYHKQEAKRRLNRIGGGSQKDPFSLYLVVSLHDGHNIRDNCPENAPKGSASGKSTNRKVHRQERQGSCLSADYSSWSLSRMMETSIFPSSRLSKLLMIPASRDCSSINMTRSSLLAVMVAWVRLRNT
uniref:Uncharacterized protein n=1 Tax=Pectobacterium carotovorum TaxID=554 RepID=A0A0N9NBJ4_PECCA|nr:Hypothetical protein [Pectobacterium carotovorum]